MPSPNFDWTRKRPNEKLTAFQRFTRDEVDWHESPLGAPEQWPPQLRHMVQIVTANPSPAALFWGERPEDMAIVYNEAYTALIGSKHPRLQGQYARPNLQEVWDQMVSIFCEQFETGETVIGDVVGPLLLDRHGFLEESYFSYKCMPVLSFDNGTYAGTYAVTDECTTDVLAERRSSTLDELNSRVAQATTLDDLWRAIPGGLSKNHYDVPLAMLYSMGHSLTCKLEAVLGIEQGHRAAPASFNLEEDAYELAASFREAFKRDRPLLVDISNDQHLAALFDGVAWRGHGVPSNSIAVCHLKDGPDDFIRAFLVLGLNARRPYSAIHQEFIQSIRNAATAPYVVQSMLRQEVEAKKQAEADAELMRQSFDKQLAAKQAAYENSEQKFARFANRLPMGVGIADSKGNILYGNPVWRRFVQVSEDSTEPFNFMSCCVPEQDELIWKMWADLEAGRPVNSCLRLKTLWTAPDGQQLPMTALITAYTDVDHGGEVTMMSCVADVSELKWIEAQLLLRTAELERRMDEAIELKRQQERFIDMTSHEIRNPLSAMIHCTDEIIENCKTKPDGFADHSLEAAYTIDYCAKHIRNIVGDVLTLSKLGSKLVEICPVPIIPCDMIKQALHMFSGEARAEDIDLTFAEHSSMRHLNIEWLLLDPIRVLQILVNLVTNALKFTRARPLRRVSIELSADLKSPPKHPDDVSYVPPRAASPIASNEKVGGDAQSVYLTIAVEDTGVGITAEEKALLFKRFKQASPKTETKYGGSGLGLFISRDLTELQGGGIGVRSEPGVGTKFVFYIETKRAEAPTEVSPIDISEITMRVRPLNAKLPASVSESAQEVSRQTNGPLEEDIRSLQLADTVQASWKKILIVEDNLINQKVLAKQLRKRGYDVATADHGKEALNSLHHAYQSKGTTPPFDVCLLDVEMPVMDGITCAQEIRAAEAAGRLPGHLPIIAVTANVRVEQTDRAKSAGVDGITTKPYRIDELVATIEKVCRTL